MAGAVDNPIERRVCILVPTAKDREITCALFAGADLACIVCEDLAQLSQEFAAGAGALLVTEDIIGAEGIDELLAALSGQAGWSDIPIVMLMRGGVESPAAARVLAALRNVTVLERPAPMRSVLSAVQAALRARQRQYQIRDQFKTIRRARTALGDSKRLYAAIGESINYGVWVCEPDGRNVYVSKSFLDLIGMTQEECSGAGWIKALHPDDIEATRAAWQACVRSGENWYREHRFKGVDGQWHPVLACGVPVRNEHDRIIKWAGINLDISRLKESEERERAARMEAERTGRLKDEFLATLSHELRTPLSAILGWAHILRRGNPTADDLRQGLDTIERNARVQTKLIEDLLDMSRIISGKVRLDVMPIHPMSFIEAAVETMRPAAEAKGVLLEQSLDPAAGPVLGDVSRLQQVIWNLVSNAIKFTPKGGKVQVLLERRDPNVDIRVVDSGEGIGTDFLPSVFERFRQADGSTARRHGGLGLGLAIVKHLIEMHGGTVAATSAGKGLGSTFSVSLPLAAIRRDAESPKRPRGQFVGPQATNGRQASLTGLKVLVVDDESDSRNLLRRILEECHAEVATAGSAVEGVQLVASFSPDVLVSDIGMPGVDGYEFLRRVRALEPRSAARLPAIALTAFARSEDRSRALLSGYSVHVAKPVEPSELVATVAAVAGRTAGVGS